MKLNISNMKTNSVFVAFEVKSIGTSIIKEDNKEYLPTNEYGYVSGPYSTKEEVINYIIGEGSEFWARGTRLFVMEVKIKPGTERRVIDVLIQNAIHGGQFTNIPLEIIAKEIYIKPC